MAISGKTDFFLDFQRFSDMKLRARENSDSAANEVARQFEGLFVQQMLSAMRSASSIEGARQSSYMDFYQEMYDKQLAQIVAGQDRLGVSRLIMRQMPAESAQAPAAGGPLPIAAGGKAEMPLSTPRAAIGAAAAEDSPQAVLGAPVTAPGDTATPARVVLGRVVDDDFAEVGGIERAGNRWQQPQQFIADIWPAAQAAAERLGVSAELLMAQSALETGWGKHTMKFDDGRSSYNLFGIKAGAEWRGAALQRNSLEYRDGLLQSEVSRFRAYDSPRASLDDYVDFIRSNPRYEPALARGGDDRAYIRAIHQAGYATDPDYADKVIAILDGTLLKDTLAAIDTGVSSYG